MHINGCEIIFLDRVASSWPTTMGIISSMESNGRMKATRISTYPFVVLAEAIYRVMIGGQGWAIYSTMLQGPCLLEGSLVGGVHFLSTFRAEHINM
jgi:hypothetical protein